MVNSLSTIASFAQRALLYEVALTPKPGLVDRQNSGAHQDMDYWTFLASSAALGLYFPAYLEAGYTHQGTPAVLFKKLRDIGQQAETAMFAATKGINTHKGANFSFALLLGALGLYWQKKPSLPLTPDDTKQIMTLVQSLTKDLLQADFQNLDQKKNLSYGERLYLEHGITGIRGEAMAGYPALQDLLAYFRTLSSPQKDQQETILLRGLVYLMATVEDGNLLHRGGLTAWQTVRQTAQELQDKNLPETQLHQALAAYDQQLIQANLSPGGAADVLALGIFMGFLEGLFD